MQCKKNDLAFIKKSIRPQNIGLIVTCAEYLGYYLQGDIVELNGEHFAAIVSDNYWMITSGSGSIETQFGKSKMCYIPDLWLTPIKDEPLEDDVFTSEELTDEITV